MNCKNIRYSLILSILLSVAILVLIAFAVLEIYEEGETGGSAQALNCGYFSAIMLLIINKGRKNKRYYYKMFMENIMSNDMILELTGKSVQIRTLDEYIDGVVKSTDGDFIIVEKQKKNGTKRIFVNKNAIQTIKIK